MPPGVKEIEAPWPLEISGVAAVPEGYLVVGGDTDDHARIWPGGERWPFPRGMRIQDIESVDVEFGPARGQLRLLLAEWDRDEAGGNAEHAGLFDQRGGRAFFSELRELCGRGLEGVTVRWNEGQWQVAIVWEGGFLDLKKCPQRKGEWKNPKVSVFNWVAAQGLAGSPSLSRSRLPGRTIGSVFAPPISFGTVTAFWCCSAP